MSSEAVYLETLRQWVLDDKKVVTYRFLGNQLQIPSDIAKQLLYVFVKKQQGISVVYFLSGVSSSGAHLVSVVQDKKLEEIKKTMSTIFSLHVYSVQEKMASDSSVLFSVDNSSYQEMEEKAGSANNPYVTNEFSTVELAEGQETLIEQENSTNSTLKTEELEKKAREDEERQIREKREQRQKEEEKEKRAGKRSKKENRVKKGALTNYFSQKVPESADVLPTTTTTTTTTSKKGKLDSFFKPKVETTSKTEQILSQESTSEKSEDDMMDFEIVVKMDSQVKEDPKKRRAK